VNDVAEFYDDFVDYQLSFLTTPNRRLRRVRGHLQPLLVDHAPRSALDIGCGIGLMSSWLAERVSRVVGVDISPRSVEAASRLFSSPEFVVCAPPADPLPSGAFDLVTLIDVVEHLPAGELPKLFERIGEVAAEKAVVAVNVPSKLFALRGASDQVIDEALGVDEIVAAASVIGMEPLVVSRYGCETANQYVFCAFARSYDVTTPVRDSLHEQLRYKAWSVRRRIDRRGPPPPTRSGRS
jgi:SAM-dependent methyltransferase